MVVPEPRQGFYVYFLWDDDKLVYAGSSVNVVERVAAHRRTKVFTRATYLEYATEDDMRTAEALYIRRFTPPMNGLISYMGYAGRDMPLAISADPVVLHS